MDLESFQLLLSPAGQHTLAEAMSLEPREADFLTHLTALSRMHPRELARTALETAILRREAAVKFPQPEQMYFTRPALEQATSYEVSEYRSRRFAAFERLLDLGCSIGGDTAALAALAPTTGVDLDPLRLALACTNLKAMLPDRDVNFLQADLTHPLPLQLSPRLGIFFDPARRAGGRRIHSVHRYHPPLEVIRRWLPHTPAVGVKLSPGVDLQELAGYEAEVEFISLGGELKEALLWFGPLRTAARRATLLPGPYTLAASSDEGGSRADSGPVLPLGEPRRYLYEPDPAILRAGLVRALGAQLDAAQLDPAIAYLTSDRLVETPFARAYTVEDWLPFNLKRLRSVLRQRGVERAVVKKRGSPIQPEALLRDLHLKPAGGPSDAGRIIFLTHLRGKPIAVICLP
jgi:SAM-dependent methyltransferase